MQQCRYCHTPIQDGPAGGMAAHIATVHPSAPSTPPDPYATRRRELRRVTLRRQAAQRSRESTAERYTDA